MDTSKAYIKMCDCPEVQKHWKMESVDFHGIPCADSHDYTGITFKPYKDSKDVKNVVTIWLPRQDQIQEMLGNFVWTNVLMEECFKGKYPSELPMDTWEKRWLHLYMQKKHQKVWDGEKWVSTVVDKGEA